MLKNYLIDESFNMISFAGLYAFIRSEHPELFGYQISDEFSYHPVKYLEQIGVVFQNKNILYVKSQINEIIYDFKEYTDMLFVLSEVKYRLNRFIKKYTGELISKSLIQTVHKEIINLIQSVENEYRIQLNEFELVPNIIEKDGILLINFNYKEK